MQEITLNNNSIELIGKMISNLEFSHDVYGEGFYTFSLEVPRLSANNDIIPITISERLLKGITLNDESFFQIIGQFRSYNNYENESHRLILTVFAREIIPIDDCEKIKNPNQIFLNGFVCKKPIYRTTPFGREICDMLIAVNRQYNKSDYIPCIAWGRNAKYSESLCVGDSIKIWGRIQSRSYQKKTDETNVIQKTAYEVSVIKLDVGEKERLQEINSGA